MIQYLKGDATNPINPSDIRSLGKIPVQIILQLQNNMGYWDAGFSLALSNRYPKLKESYFSWFNSVLHSMDENDFRIKILGQIHCFQVNNAKTIVTLVAQDYVHKSGVTVDYNALDKALSNLYDLLTERSKRGDLYFNLHLPRIGTGISQGCWNEVERLLERNFVHVMNPINMFVYDLQ